MSVLIKGRGMPTRCADCLLEYDGILCRATGNSFIYRSEAEGGYVDFYDTRMPDCPLVHVPPHGRLIDADALMNEGWTLHKQTMWMGNCATHVISLDNPNVPTVIPADKDGDA